MEERLNCHWLLNQNPCDLLINIQKNGCGCILKALDSRQKSAVRCVEYDGKCEKCIQDWMNEPRK